MQERTTIEGIARTVKTEPVRLIGTSAVFLGRRVFLEANDSIRREEQDKARFDQVWGQVIDMAALVRPTIEKSDPNQCGQAVNQTPDDKK